MMLKKGFLFGMTLQFAVGPVCISIRYVKKENKLVD